MSEISVLPAWQLQSAFPATRRDRRCPHDLRRPSPGAAYNHDEQCDDYRDLGCQQRAPFRAGGSGVVADFSAAGTPTCSE